MRSSRPSMPARYIFAPLEMTSSSAAPDAQERLGLADSYNWWFGFGPSPAREQFRQVNLPDGFLASTADDMSHYLVAQLNGGRFRRRTGPLASIFLIGLTGTFAASD